MGELLLEALRVSWPYLVGVPLGYLGGRYLARRRVSRGRFRTWHLLRAHEPAHGTAERVREHEVAVVIAAKRWHVLPDLAHNERLHAAVSGLRDAERARDREVSDG